MAHRIHTRRIHMEHIHTRHIHTGHSPSPGWGYGTSSSDFGSRRSRQVNSDRFSRRCRVARRPIKTECDALRTQMGGTRCSPGDVAVAASRRHLNGHGSHSAATPVVGFSALCRLRDHSYVVGSTRHAPGYPCDATGSQGLEAVLSPDNSREISEGSTFSNLREVIMTMSEYEERFRPPAPSLHQTFAEIRGPNRGGRRGRHLWVVAALVGVMTITSKAALHHSTHASGSQVLKSGIQACD